MLYNHAVASLNTSEFLQCLPVGAWRILAALPYRSHRYSSV